MSTFDSHISPAVNATYPVRAGNRVQPWVDGLPTFRRIGSLVEAARERVWVTVAFIEADFRMPDDRGSFFDLLDRAAKRGVDVRAIFWSEPEAEKQVSGADLFPASEANFAFLRERESKLKVRWDRVVDFCQHQKSWIVDDAQGSELAFVGGINLERSSVVAPGHPPEDDSQLGHDTHDLYCEIEGPASTDVRHNFIQRWNEASERGQPHGAYPSLEIAEDLAFPEACGPAAGPTPVQITRSVQKALYSVGHPAPGAAPFAIEKGEKSILEQYLSAIDAARSSVYLENQLLLCPETIQALRRALDRGVSVTVLVPHKTMPEVIKARKHPLAKPLFEALDALGECAEFTFVALARNRAAGEYEDIYVHAKFALVDDCWVTIGSTNTMFRSFRGDTEMNASFWDAAVARKLRVDLLLEHLGEDTSAQTDREAFARYREIAQANRTRRANGEPMKGQVFTTDPSRWATEDD